MGQETLNLFPNEQVLEAICQWSNSLKQLHQRLGKYYKRSEARGAVVSQKQLDGRLKMLKSRTLAFYVCFIDL